MTGTISHSRKQIDVPAEETIFRPAIYGILIENQRVLLQQHGESGLWRPVGDVLQNGQTPLQTLCVNFRAAVQFSPRPGPLVFMEQRHRLDEDGRRWRLSHLYYLVYRPSGPVAAANADNGDGTELASWVSLHDLSREQMQFGYVAVQTAARRLEQNS